MTESANIEFSPLHNAEAIPRHCAVIMDGNGRWAKQRGWLRTRGHQQGVDAVRMVSTEAAKLGIQFLTLYAFSSENWQRPQREIDVLMKLLRKFLQQELSTLLNNNIKLNAIGRLERLPAAVLSDLNATIEKTAHCSGMVLTLALSYGGRDELVDAMKDIAAAVQSGAIDPASLTAEHISARLYHPAGGDVDLLIRTAGEKRVSNFLPWQAVYAEYVSCASLWPDFSYDDFIAAVREYQQRERRFGAIK